MKFKFRGNIIINNYIKNSPVCLFMKGTPDSPQCGFSMAVSNVLKHLGVNFTGNLPLPEDVFSITPLPWATGRSWAEGIERGLSGLGHLLRKNKGRSGAAIQTSVKVRGGKFQNTPYISAFLRKYKKKFEELK